jgi:nucleotide-binding universal stress UspA family protein
MLGAMAETLKALESQLEIDARENNIDIVVVASRGLGGTRRLLLGRVSHEIARKAKLPVIVVS